MNHGKVDAALAAALAGATDTAARTLPVSVELSDDTGAAAEDAKTRLGIGGTGRFRAATLSADQVGELSDEPWVRRLRLSTALHLTDGT